MSSSRRSSIFSGLFVGNCRPQGETRRERGSAPRANRTQARVDSERVLERRPPWRSSRGYVTPIDRPSTAPRQRIQQRTRTLRFCHPSLTSTAPSQTPCIQQQKRQRMEQMKKLGIGKFENQVGTPSRNPHAPTASTHSCGHPRRKIFPEISPENSLTVLLHPSPSSHTGGSGRRRRPGHRTRAPRHRRGHHKRRVVPPRRMDRSSAAGRRSPRCLRPVQGAPLRHLARRRTRPVAPPIRPTRSARHGQAGIRRPVRGTRHRPHEQQQVLRPGGVRREGSIVREDW